ncbi:LysR family transcriptional regulator [Acidaminobacter hydrogenoformans]|uniref:DNA-binding transcriptional regulator, LysR family n=1 Tax=Acidaminobacter hydrogenoformans DSM 2784 TaxID=1120920 RepID=A0A1G5S836_9FIRM|nr:LysR family transcriptional regulator [Acidaminobacter hydrogenoformans]SCZ81881.1 DNA-binding transcriptional regulator, LysR family [Acidaminobacter hydrogenoformans DSM 2784]
MNPLSYETKPASQSVTLRHLRIFIAVSDLGTMTAAAKALYIAQPTVSQAISELEAFYGVRLFERLSKKLYMTPQGFQLLDYARHISSLYNRMDMAMGDASEGSVVKVGASMTIGSCFLPQVVEAFTKKYTDVPIEAVIRNTRDIEAMILKNEIDFALVEGTVHSTNIYADPFDEDRLLLLCGRGHPLYGSGKLETTALSGKKFIVREEGSGTRELFETSMAAAGIPWQAAWVYSGSDGLISAAIHNLGIAVISRRLAAKALESGELWPLQVEGFDLIRRFFIIRHKNKYLTGPMKNFINFCTELSRG